MGRYEREVLEAVNLRGSLTVVELAAMLGVSDQTIRRVVAPMADRGDIVKVHGAVMSVRPSSDPPFLARMDLNRRAKIDIAATVAAIVDDGDSLALDVGSTTGFVAQALRQHRNLRVVTNSALIASSLATIPGNRVHLAGVELRNHDGAAFDHQAFETVKEFRVRYAVLSASGVHPTHGFMVHDHAEARMSAAMGDIADQRIVAVDRSKFDLAALITIEGLREGDIVVTDARPPRRFATVLKPFDVRVTTRT